MSRMRRLRAWTIAAGLASLALVPGQIQAQQTEAELEQEILELMPQLEAAREWHDAQEIRRNEMHRNAAAEAASTDTIQVGPLTVVGLPSQIDDARKFYQGVWRDFADFANGSPALAEHMFTYQLNMDLKPIHIDGPEQRAEVRTFRGLLRLEENGRNAIGRALETDFRNTELFEWTRGAVIPPRNLSDVYRILAVSDVKSVQECLEGVSGACLLSLGLDLGPDAWKRWYTADQRMALVQRSGGFYWIFRGRQVDEGLAFRCLDADDAEACDAILSEANVEILKRMAPLGMPIRSTFLWTAVKSGGEGAWLRLIERSDADPATALAYAYGGDLLDLEAEWRDAVLAARPDVKAGLDTTRWMVLLWAFVFIGLAMRSTRWRLG